jgi:hypothetical protein
MCQTDAAACRGGPGQKTIGLYAVADVQSWEIITLYPVGQTQEWQSISFNVTCKACGRTQNVAFARSLEYPPHGWAFTHLVFFAAPEYPEHINELDPNDLPERSLSDRAVEDSE